MLVRREKRVEEKEEMGGERRGQYTCNKEEARDVAIMR